MRTITDLSFAPFDVELREPFGIATGAQLVARNVIVRLRLDDGSEGLGEAAPFPAVNGETQAQALAALPAAAAALRGQSASRYRHTAALAREVLQHTKSALAAVETALLDALCRSAGISLWSFFGGAEPILYTDITIPTGDAEAARSAALKAWEGGFRTLKVKVGGAALESDAARVRAAHAAAPEAALVLDANASLSPAQALALLGALGPARSKLVLFEQPTPAEDLAALRAVQQEGGVAVAADESARSVADVLSIVAAQAARVVNVKITKTGLLEAWDMITVARAHGLALMIGGMVETELAMTTSACLAAGIGGFAFVDLDTPLFMRARALEGGFQQRGARLDVSGLPAGHGVRLSALT